ncbi:MAG: peptidase S41 [Rhodospirillaceae bacterium]|nr:peptidase S41 [Rhodospirillaceae bacterium]|tara:strand:- start:7385 stop:8650 length:1266 start_codon:yes stop_codon:yes gene_type:complete
MNNFLIKITILTLFVFYPSISSASGNGETFRQLELFGDIFEKVRKFYVEDTNDKKLIESAINGMLQSLDPHSSYLNEDSYSDMKVQTRGEFGGLGIEVTMEQGFVRVVSPIDNTPAARAGLETGDFITHLDGKPVLGINLAEAVDKMRGRVGSDIKLTIRREGKDPFDVVITRAIIQIQSVRGRAEDKIGYLRITSFNDKTYSGLSREINKLKKELDDNMHGLVLDLRRNPGGLLHQAIKVSDAFLERGEIVSTRGRNNKGSKRFNARSGDLINGLPMVVLINGGSASASEIVAGALQDHRRAVIMGTQSFGKGSVQTIMPISGHGAMRLTTASYFTPSGRSIQKTGITPDIEVQQVKVETTGKKIRLREKDLRNARDGEKLAPKPSNPQINKATKTSDYQLNRAIDLLKGISLYSISTTK